MDIHELYGGDITLKFDPTKHLYWANEKKALSVTGIIGVINKPALIQWAANQASTYWKENIKVGDVVDEVAREELYESGRYAHRRFAKKAADIGTLAHNWIEKHIKGEKPALPVNKMVRTAVEAFLAWEKENDVKFHESEIKIYSKKYKYAGTMDFEATVNGKLVIGDIKTSSGIYSEMRFQVAAYRQAREEETGNKYDHQVIVRIGKKLVNDKPDFEIQEFDDFKQDIKGFLGALLLTNRLNELKQK